MRILLICGTLPWPLGDSGGAQRSGLLLQALRRWGEVDVLVTGSKQYLEMPHIREKMLASKESGFRILELDFEREANPWRLFCRLSRGKIRDLFRELGRCKYDYGRQKTQVESLHKIVDDGKYDVIVVRFLRYATRTGAAFLPGANVLLDIDDVDWQKHRSARDQPGTRSLFKRLRDDITAWYLERNAKKHLKNFKHIWIASEEDRRQVGALPCSVLPNVPILPSVDTESPSREAPEHNTILFVGTLGYGPNMHGLDHFLTAIWPAVHEAHAQVRLRVVGRPPKDRQRVDAWGQAPNVDLVGFVDDLGESYAQALFTIAPIYWGGGTKIKVLESLGRGRTCVATSQALYGLDEHIRHDDSVWRADTDHDFLEGCCTLIEDGEMRKRLESKGEALIRNHYSIKRFNQAVDNVMRQFRESPGAE